MDDNDELSDPSSESESEDTETEEEYQDKAKGRVPLPGDPTKLKLELEPIERQIGNDQTSLAVQARTFPQLPIIPPELITNDIPDDLILPRQRVQAGLAQDSTLEQRTYSLNRWTAGIMAIGAFGGLSGAVAAIYEVVRSHNNKSGPVLPPGTPNTPLVTSLLDQWNELSDDDFWTALANYVDLNADKDTALTLTDQYQFMSYVIDLWPLTGPWMWQGSDALSARDYFLEQYALSGNDTAAMYRAVPTYEYQGNTMPRAVAATVMQYALAKLIVDTSSNSMHRRLSAP